MKVIIFLAISIGLVMQAQANDSSWQSTCSARYEGQPLKVSFSYKQEVSGYDYSDKCERCSPAYSTSYTVKVSFFDAHDLLAKQVYTYKSTDGMSSGTSYSQNFEKIKSVQSGSENWFPEEIKIQFENNKVPIEIKLKEEFLELDCEN